MNESTDSTRTSGVRAKASKLKNRLQEDGKQRIETGKRAAADQIAELADAIDVAGSQLDQSQPTLANYASRLADGVGTLATRLREDSVEDIYRDVRQLAARNPGMFLLGSAALGVVIARFMKATSDEYGAAGSGEDLGEAAESETQEWGDATVDVNATSGSDIGTGSSSGTDESTNSADPASLYQQPPAGSGGSMNRGV